MARQSRLFLALHRRALSDHARWFLEQLTQLADDFEVAFGWATSDVARGLSDRPPNLPVRERDLEELFVECLRGRLPDAIIERQKNRKLTTWPRVGALDVIATWGDAATGVELKWWGGDSTGRYQTLWDATKLASFVQEQKLGAAYLLSGGTRASWELNDPFTRLFEDGEQVTADLARPPANWWVLLTHEKTDVPATLVTSSIAQEPFAIDEVAYGLRLARVRPGDGLYRVPARAPRAR